MICRFCEANKKNRLAFMLKYWLVKLLLIINFFLILNY